MNTNHMFEIPKDWKPPKFTKEDNPHGLLIESSFSVLYPKYREFYIRENWPKIKHIFKQSDLIAELDLLQGRYSVKTIPRKTWDPYIIIKARDVLKLIARSVPYEQAVKVLEDDIVCDVIKIGSLVKNKERFVKRRQRLIGSNGSTLKALELLTGCYTLVHGNTVSSIGTHAGIKEVRKMVEDAMNNVHPIYNIKALMIKKELLKDERLSGENWERFLPKFKNKRIKKKQITADTSGNTSHYSRNFKPNNEVASSSIKLKKHKRKPKKEYTPFPPPPIESKIDKEIETGEYFLKHSLKKQKELLDKMSKQKLATKEKKIKKMKVFNPPIESFSSTQPEKRTKSIDKLNIKRLKKKLKTIESRES